MQVGVMYFRGCVQFVHFGTQSIIVPLGIGNLVMKSLFRRTPVKIALLVGIVILMLSFYNYYTYGTLDRTSPPKGILTALVQLVVPEPTPSVQLCKDPMCTEYLLPQIDVGFFNNCSKRHEASPIWEDFSSNHTCRFMNGTHRGPVALVSFPGSGNTWVRGLLEQATGICTGERIKMIFKVKPQ